MIEKKFNGQRLREALQFRSMKMTDLAKQTGISKQSISLYANNENTPPFENVLKIAHILSFPFDFFVTADLCTTSTSNTYFRSQATTRKKDQRAQQQRLEYLAKLQEVLLEYVDLPLLDLPSTADFSETFPEPQCISAEKITTEIESVARKTREYWGLGTGPIHNIKHQLEAHGVFVTSGHGIDRRIDAFSQKVNIQGSGSVFLVGLSDEKSAARLNFDMAHELGHILMHNWDDSNDDLTHDEFNNLERQANFFASSFLLPRESFVPDVAPYATKLDYYITLKAKWHVSIQAMMYRARQLNIITHNQFQYMMRTLSAKGWRTQEPGDELGTINDTIFKSTIKLLLNEGGFTPESLMKSFYRHNIYLNQDDLEDLLGLPSGTLSCEKKVISLVSIKKMKQG